MKLEIGNLYDTVRSEFTCKHDLMDFILSCSKIDYTLHIVAVLPVVNTLKNHPEWLEDTASVLFQDPCISKLLLRAYLILLHKGFIAPEKVIKAVNSHQVFTLNTPYNAEGIEILQEIALMSPHTDSQFRVKIYSNIAFLHQNHEQVALIPEMISLLIKDFSCLDTDLSRAILFILYVDFNLRHAVIDYVRNNNSEHVFSFLQSIITRAQAYFSGWNYIYTLIACLKEQFPLFIERLKLFKDHFLSESLSNPLSLRFSPHFFFWAYLIDAEIGVIPSKMNLEVLSPLIPYIPEKKFLPMLRIYNLKTRKSLPLLNNLAVAKDRKALLSLLKLYLRSNDISVKSDIPAIPIEADVIRGLSHIQVSALAERSYKIQNDKGLIPVRFKYTPEALIEMRTKLTAAITAKSIDPTVVNQFIQAQEMWQSAM